MKPRFVATGAHTSARCRAASSKDCVRAESNNPVFMLDEIDKVGADFRGDPSSALLEVLDPQQNNSFSDHYLELPFDPLAGHVHHDREPARTDLAGVARPHGDHSTARLHEHEKLHIATKYLIPRQLSEHGLKREQLHILSSAVGGDDS